MEAIYSVSDHDCDLRDDKAQQEREERQSQTSAAGGNIFTPCSAKIEDFINPTRGDLERHIKTDFMSLCRVRMRCVLQCVNEAARLSLLKERNSYFFLFT